MTNATSNEIASGPTAEGPGRRPNRRFAVLGVTAGLIGGGAIGLTATMPSLTSAASSDSAPTAAPVVAEDDGAPTEGTVDGAAIRERRSERMRESLQTLVDDGTIDGAQADAVADHLASEAPGRIGRRGPGGHGRGALGEAVTEALGIEAEALREQLRAGSTIADIAAENGVELQTVIDAMLAEVSEKLDQAVADGRLSEDDASAKLDQAAERIEARVNGERPARG